MWNTRDLTHNSMLSSLGAPVQVGSKVLGAVTLAYPGPEYTTEAKLLIPIVI